MFYWGENDAFFSCSKFRMFHILKTICLNRTIWHNAAAPKKQPEIEEKELHDCILKLLLKLSNFLSIFYRDLHF